jgi:tetratricopeptide (TPR) repeat protein
MIEKLQKSSEAEPQLRRSHTEATLIQCAREVISKGMTLYEASQAAESTIRDQRVEKGHIAVAGWLSLLESLRLDQRNFSSNFAMKEAHTIMGSETSATCVIQERDAVNTAGEDSDDDLETDLAKAALDTGTKAFEAQEWEEAESLLQEALRLLLQLSQQQRAFCDIFALQFRLTVCSYHTQQPADAEAALTNLVQQSASSDRQHEYIYDASHLLSHLYIRTGQIDRARSECEKALQGRRRLLGKRSDAALESTALMAHIYVLLDNRARAKSYLAIIPEPRRDTILKLVEESLGPKVEHFDLSSQRTRSISENSDVATKSVESRLSVVSLAPPMETHSCGSTSEVISQSPRASLVDLNQHSESDRAGLEDLQSNTVTSRALIEVESLSRATEKQQTTVEYSTDPEVVHPATLSSYELPEAIRAIRGTPLSRKEVLDKIGCQPKDRIEQAVCDGDHLAFAGLLNKKKDFWQSKLRKRVRSERVTALHFAALFGEIDMARRLIRSSFNINEVPWGYSTSLTPLTFAIGARQVDMVNFLIANGARPSEPDSWSTLAGQLMNRSWLAKTMSEEEKEYAPNQIIAIMRILLNQGWDVKEAFESSGGTVLHQAVTFWTGSYRWDLNLRVAITSFLCQRGADPFQANKEGKTPYDMALASGHQDLLLILGRGSKMKETDDRPVEPIELSI